MTADGDRPVPLPYDLEIERFVQYVVVGGLTLVLGLWVAALTAPWSVRWVVGVLAAVGGLVVSLAGVWRELST